MPFLLAPLAAVFLWASSVSSRHHVVAADITAVTLYPLSRGGSAPILLPRVFRMLSDRAKPA